MRRPEPPPNDKFRVSHDGLPIVLVAIACLFVIGYWSALRAGAVHCNHACYWCGKPLGVM